MLTRMKDYRRFTRRWLRQSCLEWRFPFAPQHHFPARTTVVQSPTHARTPYIRSVVVPTASTDTVSVPRLRFSSHHGPRTTRNWEVKRPLKRT